ncbi:MAG: flagellar filament capping protein FliD [Candidatus Krumholzibacteriia bacterium]
MSSISFGGLATGLDTGSIVTQLVALRRQPIVKLGEQKSLYERQQAALKDLQSKLTALKNAADALDTAQSFGSLSATSSLATVLTASASGDAQEGTYNITVESLARAQKDLSQAYTSQVAEVGTGTFTITVGGTVTELTLAEGDSSLTSLKNAINDSGASVRASIINDGSATSPYRLVLTAAETGTDAAFSIDLSGLSGGVAPTLTNITAATNASLTIDSLTVTSQSNLVSNAIEGVTLNLLKQDPGTAITVAVNIDTDAIAAKLQTMVTSYNDLMTYIKAQQAKGATLQGNNVVRSVQSRISDVAIQGFDGIGQYSLLSQVGLTQEDGGLLAFDRTKFDSAVAADYGSVRDLFVERSTNLGKAYQFRTAVEQLTDTKTGVFKITDDSLTDRMKEIDARITRYEESVASYQQVLERKFTAMELAVSTLQAQGNYLTSVFAKLTSN